MTDAVRLRVASRSLARSRQHGDLAGAGTAGDVRSTAHSEPARTVGVDRDSDRTAPDPAAVAAGAQHRRPDHQPRPMGRLSRRTRACLRPAGIAAGAQPGGADRRHPHVLVQDLSRDPANPLVYNPLSGSGALGVEFVCTSITSPGLDALDPLTPLLRLPPTRSKRVRVISLPASRRCPGPPRRRWRRERGRTAMLLG